MDYSDSIIEAIRTKRQMQVNYKGEGRRIVCPHILYYSSSGNKLVDIYQISGFSNHPENIPGWRPFYISEITEITILDDTFEAANGYNPHNPDRYPTIIEKI